MNSNEWRYYDTNARLLFKGAGRSVNNSLLTAAIAFQIEGRVPELREINNRVKGLIKAKIPGFTLAGKKFTTLREFTVKGFKEAFKGKQHIVMHFEVDIEPETLLKEKVNLYFEIKRCGSLEAVMGHWFKTGKKHIPLWVYMTENADQFALNIAESMSMSFARHIITKSVLEKKYGNLYVLYYDKTKPKEIVLVSTIAKIREFMENIKREIQLSYVKNIKFSRII